MAAGEFLEPTQEKQIYLAREKQAEVLKQRFDALPAADKNLFLNGSYFLALNGSLCGLTANNYFRRSLHITQARFASSLPMVFLPFVSTVIAYEAFVTQPLLEGDLNCSSCTWIRGGLLGAFVGGLYPALLALPMNAALATRYFTTPMPDKENMFRYWIMVCKPVMKKMKFAAILQAALGTFLSSKHYGIYMKMLQLSELGSNPEELKE